MKTSQRLGLWGLVVLLGGTVGGFGLVTPAHAEDRGPETTSVKAESTNSDGEDCVNSFVSRGRAVVAGPSYEIPFRSVGGAPYVENEINSQPLAFSFASNAYEGYIGDIILGTSGVYPRNPTSAAAHYPPVADAKGGEGATKQHYSQGPLGRSEAEAKPNEAKSEARALGDGEASGGLIGPSTARSHTLFDGQLVKGIDEVIGYDLHLGPLPVRQMHSTVTYESDGTAQGTKGTWELELSGVGGDDKNVYTITADGVHPQGGQPQPGSAAMKQFNDGAKGFADALEKAGLTRPEIKIAPGSIEVRGPGELYIQAAALELRNAVVDAKNGTFQGQGFVFGWHERYVKVDLASCDVAYSKRPLEEYKESRDTTAKEVGPVRFPDPSEGGGGGPGGGKSTTPAAVLTSVPTVGWTPPTTVGHALGMGHGLTVGARPTTVPCLREIS